MLANNRTEVSVIVPIYNEEDHIVDCLKQLKEQDFINAEFILIDDGSTDQTLKIIEKFLINNRDERFKIYTKKNGGASSARNYGIDRAKGYYLMFKDADDLCTSNYISSYYEAIKNENVDIAFFGIERVNSNGESMNWPEMKALNISGKIDAHNLLDIYSRQELRGYSVTYISKRSLWKKVRFNEKFSYQEDSLALLELILNNPSLVAHMNKESYYYYVLNPQSLTRNVNADVYWQAVNVDNRIINKMKKTNFFEDLIPNMYAHNLTNLSTLIGYCLINNDYLNYKKARKQYLSSFIKSKIDKSFKLKRYFQVLLLIINNKFLTTAIYRKVMRNN